MHPWMRWAFAQLYWLHRLSGRLLLLLLLGQSLKLHRLLHGLLGLGGLLLGRTLLALGGPLVHGPRPCWPLLAVWNVRRLPGLDLHLLGLNKKKSCHSFFCVIVFWFQALPFA